MPNHRAMTEITTQIILLKKIPVNQQMARMPNHEARSERVELWQVTTVTLDRFNKEISD